MNGTHYKSKSDEFFANAKTLFLALVFAEIFLVLFSEKYNYSSLHLIPIVIACFFNSSIFLGLDILSQNYDQKFWSFLPTFLITIWLLMFVEIDSWFFGIVVIIAFFCTNYLRYRRTLVK